MSTGWCARCSRAGSSSRWVPIRTAERACSARPPCSWNGWACNRWSNGPPLRRCCPNSPDWTRMPFKANHEVEVEILNDTGVRLQKVLAAAGLGSRRACEELIAAGRVDVDGELVVEMGRRVDPASAVVHVDGQRINVRADLVYLALNKPRGVLSAMSDSRGRPTVAGLISDRPERLFHIGRLDVDSEGLLLLTNDGDLAHRLMHPSFGVAKTYLATVPGPIAREVGRQLRTGVELDDGPVQVDGFRVMQT